MSAGELKLVLTCVPTQSAADSTCGQINGVNHVLQVSQHVLIDSDLLPLFTELTEPFSPVFAAGVFGFFFSTVLTLWVVGKSVGAIIQAVRKF
ncbi:MAG: hypothetical protein ACK5Q1_08005 [Limnobacter sp.]|jgi:hypothetical protein